jgi:Zn finger protein HypA/HybF involved in hydrogenase expression
MKLKDAVGLGKACGLESLDEYVLNIELHCMSLFIYKDIEAELAELNLEAKNAKECYQCGDPVMWLAPDSRCGDCTGYTPEEIVNGRELEDEDD